MSEPGLVALAVVEHLEDPNEYSLALSRLAKSILPHIQMISRLIVDHTVSMAALS